MIKKSEYGSYILTFIWIIGVSYGLFILYDYEYTAGSLAPVSKSWPLESNIQRFHEQYQLVMFVHPHCPCTRASIHELEVIMNETPGKLKASLLFIKPSLFDEEWTKTDIWYTAKTIPNVIPIVDNDGVEASYFGATTSGQALLYDPDGKLLFIGGVTGSRGHVGSNLGRNTVLSFVNDGASDTYSTPFFGCPLFSDLEPF